MRPGVGATTSGRFACHPAAATSPTLADRVEAVVDRASRDACQCEDVVGTVIRRGEDTPLTYAHLHAALRGRQRLRSLLEEDRLEELALAAWEFGHALRSSTERDSRPLRAPPLVALPLPPPSAPALAELEHLAAELTAVRDGFDREPYALPITEHVRGMAAVYGWSGPRTVGGRGFAMAAIAVELDAIRGGDTLGASDTTVAAACEWLRRIGKTMVFGDLARLRRAIVSAKARVAAEERVATQLQTASPAEYKAYLRHLDFNVQAAERALDRAKERRRRARREEAARPWR